MNDTIQGVTNSSQTDLYRSLKVGSRWKAHFEKEGYKTVDTVFIVPPVVIPKAEHNKLNIPPFFCLAINMVISEDNW